MRRIAMNETAENQSKEEKDKGDKSPPPEK